MKELAGVCAAKGIARGFIHILPPLSRAVPNHQVSEESIPQELDRLEVARSSSVKEIEEILIESDLPAEHREIFDAQILLLADPMLFDTAKNRILNGKQNAAGALADTLDDFKRQFEKSPDPFFRERIADMEDVSTRVLSHLLGTAQGDPRLPFLKKLPPDAILAADEIPPSLMLHIRKVAGLAVEQGGVTGHMAILARDRGLPALVSVEGLLESVKEGQPALLNATENWIRLEPEQTDYAAMQGTQSKVRRVQSPVSLRGGGSARIWVNLDDPEDASEESVQAAHGIGLFRTEFLFYKYPDLFDSPDDHTEVYRTVFRSLRGKPVTCRLLDVGDDKALPPIFNRYLAADKQDAILRGVRFLLSHPGLLHLQLKALLEAALDEGMQTEHLRILVPLVSTRGEILEFREYYDAIRKDVSKERGISCPEFPVGIMMETPAACVMSDVLSRYATFFSLGTNDLAGLALAFHRSGPSEDPFFQPSLFRLIQTGLKGASIPVSICGEMAAIPEIVPILVEMGIHDFSVSISSLADISDALAAYDPQKNAGKLARILNAQNREEVRSILLE